MPAAHTIALQEPRPQGGVFYAFKPRQIFRNQVICLYMALPIIGQKTHSSSRPPEPKSSERVSDAPDAPDAPPSFRTGGNKIYFISLGCPRNLVDSEVMLGILLKAGYTVALTLQEADCIVINTCGFLQASRQESLDQVELVLKERKAGAKLIVTGCMVQLSSSNLSALFPKVDYLLGSGDIQGILQAVQALEPGSLVTSAKSYLQAGEVPRQLSTPRHYAYLKIAEGCRKACAYCIIPTIKGPLQSKSQEQIVKEYRALLSQGVREVILIAQDLADYGKDRGSVKLRALLSLLEELVSVDAHAWIRLLYLYPDEINDALIAFMAAHPQICPYLDMPIQHVNNALLDRMNRATNRARIIDTLRKLRAALPEITIRTSLIVGFPGETDEQFEELCQFLQDHPIDQVGVFAYSQEEGTVAAQMPDQVLEKVKERRREKLMKIQQKMVQKKNRSMIGKTLEVVVESYHPESRLIMLARHRGQCPDIDNQVLINDGRKVSGFGQRYHVEITDVAGYDLVGRVL